MRFAGILSVGLALSVATVALTAPSGCFRFEQCTQASECNAKLKASGGITYACTDGVCQRNNPFIANDAGTACTTTEACKTEHPGESWVCLKPGEAPCANLLSEECTSVGNNWDQMSPGIPPLYVGVVVPLELKSGDGTFEPQLYDRDAVTSIKMAADEWIAETGGGIAMGGAAKLQPIVPIICNSRGEKTRVENSFAHLNQLGVKSVIMRTNPDVKAGFQAATTNGMLVYCSDCLTEAFEGDLTQNLFYNSGLSLVASFTTPMKLWLSSTEQRLRKAGPLTNGSNLRVTHLGNATLGNKRFGDALEGAFEFNGKSTLQNGTDWLRIETPDESISTDIDFGKYADQIVAAKPDVIISILGLSFWTQYLPAIEAKWPAGVKKPVYIVGTDELANPPRMTSAIGSDEDLRKRVTGLMPAAPPETTSNVNQFIQAYKRQNNQETPRSIRGYESFYAVAYANAAALTSPPLNTNLQDFGGKDIGKGFSVLREGTTQDFKASKIKFGMAELRAGRSLDLVGLASSLDWKPPSNTVLTDVIVACPTRSGENLVVSPSEVFSAASQSVTIEFNPTVCNW